MHACKLINYENKWKTAERYLDVDGSPALFKGDYSGIDRVFNEEGKVIRETYAAIAHTYDDNNKELETIYYDLEGNPITVSTAWQTRCF